MSVLSLLFEYNVNSCNVSFNVTQLAIELNLKRDPANVTALLLPFDDNYLLLSMSLTRLHFTLFVQSSQQCYHSPAQAFFTSMCRIDNISNALRDSY